MTRFGLHGIAVEQGVVVSLGRCMSNIFTAEIEVGRGYMRCLRAAAGLDRARFAFDREQIMGQSCSPLLHQCWPGERCVPVGVQICAEPFVLVFSKERRVQILETESAGSRGDYRFGSLVWHDGGSHWVRIPIVV
uniref:Subtilisin-like protease fibronectin type-III domain-containing protein n=1 Tax=Oryza punctata TaxID=4537 RepID=A0A0E0KMB2_ORYPU